MKFLGILKSLWKILKVLEVLKVRGISSEVRPGPKLILMDVMKLSEGADGQYIVFHKTMRDLSPAGDARCRHRVRSWYCIAKDNSVPDANARNYCTGAQKKVAPDHIFISTLSASVNALSCIQYCCGDM